MNSAELLDKVVEHFEYLIDWAYIWHDTSENREGKWVETCRLCGQSRIVDVEKELTHHECCPIGSAKRLIKPVDELRKEAQKSEGK